MPGYDIDIEEWIDEEEFIPRYNIAPRTQAPVIRHRDHAPSGSGNNNKTLNTINARSENLIEVAVCGRASKARKDVLSHAKGERQTSIFTKRRDEKLLLLAGLYDSVVLEGKTLWTFTVVTTDANKEFSWLHDRQPVFLSNRDALLRWLDTSSQSWTPELTKMVQPYSDTSAPLDCYAVPKEVGKVGTESPTFIEPLATRRDGIKAMFSKQEQKSSPSKTSIASHKRKLEEVRSGRPSSETGNSPRPKRLKSDHGDDSKQQKTLSHKDSKPKAKASPTKQKHGKDSARGNTKLDSYFGKS
ncbi:hypothetical protein BDZ97DRAFT_1806050 [Flammula alnicola]|nr:hypothetical protein BDZ97DRAFT_1806050 [Flammula alnicola]